jgi:uncharacterized membrane protein
MEFLAEIHPKVIHFPIAFLMLYPAMELLFLITKKEFFTKAAFLFLLIGVIGALFAVLSGNQAFEAVNKIPGVNKELFNVHQTYANITVWYFTFVLVLRYVFFIKKKLDKKIIAAFLLFAVIGSYFVYQAGNYGGKFSQELTKTVYNLKQNEK